MTGQGLLAIAAFKASASLILLLLFLVFYRTFPRPFFRFWLIGWTLYTARGACRLLYRWQSAEWLQDASLVLMAAATFYFFAAVLEYTGRSRWLPRLRMLAALAAAGVAVRMIWLRHAPLAEWTSAVFFSLLCLLAGILLWRQTGGEKTYGGRLLAAALLLVGLHGLDAADWSGQAVRLLRLSFDDLLQVTIGVAMIVLVLESSRARTEDLNEKLRRLTMITAATTQTFDVDEVLRQVLRHLVELLGTTHGIVRLLEGQGPASRLVVRAATGFSDTCLQRFASVPASEPWARKVLEQEGPFLAYAGTEDAEIRDWMEAEHLAALVLLRLPGKDGTLGLLGIGSSWPRIFQEDEVQFLVNVANLLGLTVQNVRLFQQVAAAQREWRNTFDSIGDPIFVHDEECRLMRVNAAFAKRLGTEPAALVGRTVRNVLKPEDERWQRCPYCEGLAGTGDSPDPAFGGYFLATTSEFHDVAGAHRGTIHVLTDITERRRAEEKYHNLFENVQEGVFISTPEGRFLDFNDAFLRIMGVPSREELLRVDIPSTFYVNPADRERLGKLLREHGAVTNFEFEIRRPDGEIRTVMESSFATRDADGRITAYQGFILDVTERKRAEQEIRRRNRELMMLNSIALTLGESLALEEMLGRALRQVVELFGTDIGAIYLFDESSRTVRRSAAAGFRSEYARHFPPTVLPEEFVNHIRQTRATVLAAQSLPLPPIFRDLQEKEGLQISYLVVLWSEDRMMGGLVVGNRVAREFSSAELNLLNAVGNQIAATVEKTLLYDETRRAYDHLRRTQEQLLQSEKMAAMGQLISGVAHELNNPLTAILGYSQLLSDGQEVSARGAAYVSKLHKQAQRTHRIVQNLLSFARQHRPERVPVRLNYLLEETLTLREYDLKLNNIRVHRELDPKLPLTAADAHQLQQVLLNILNNAVDAVLGVSNQGDIWVRTWAENGRLCIELTDSGPGAREPMRVFDPFYTTKPVGKGTGLGLSICYGIVKEHGGEITVRNSPPRGATFCIMLPVLAVSEVHPPAPEPAWEAPLCGAVLLVDDEEALLDLEQEILRHACGTIRTAHSGREAIEILEREEIDLVVTDVKMPGDISGRELYAWIEKHRPRLAGHVVFTMSDAKADDVRDLLERTGSPFVQKPFNVTQFLQTLRQVMQQSRPSPVAH